MVSQSDTAFVDFGKAASAYAQHRQSFPADFFVRLEALGLQFAGQDVLDVGTGTGLFARDMARHGASVVGLDPSASLLAEAAQADDSVNIRYIQGSAEDIALPSASFDIISAATCWHWFDRGKAALEARRLLKPEGKLLICHLDWWRGSSGIVALTSDLIRQFNPETAKKTRPHTFQYPEWLSDLRRAGFDQFESFGYTTHLPYSHGGWVGRVRASANVGAAMSAATLAQFEHSLMGELKRLHPGDILGVEHIIFALIAKAR